MASVSALFFVYLVSLCFISVSCQQQMIFPNNEIPEGQPITVICEASSTITYIGFQDVFRLSIFRTPSNEQREVRIADYHVHRFKNAGSSNATFVRNHEGRDWNFNFTGDNGGVDNRETMKIVWEVRDTKCEDSGIYRCRLGYLFHHSEKSGTRAVDLTVTVNPTLDLSVDPEASELQYSDGEVVKITCKIRSSDWLALKWEKWVTSISGTEQFESLPSDPVIADKTAEHSDSGCYNNAKESSLEVTVSHQRETYKCIASNDEQEVKSGNITIVGSQELQPLVIPSAVVAGQPFTVYCDTSRVIPDPGFSQVFKLEIYRKVSADLRYSRMASYSYSPSDDSFIPKSFEPDERHWSFTFEGGEKMGDHNRDTIKIVLEVRDTKCEDAGTYLCRVDYLQSGNQEFATKSANMIVIYPTSKVDISVEPQSSELYYSDGEVVTFTCRTKGPDRLGLKWEKWVTSSSGTEQLESLPADAVIADKPSGFPDSGCDTYDRNSYLKVAVNATNKQETYKCIATYNKLEVNRGNITIVISQKLQPLVIPSTIIIRQPFTVYCDASRVIPDPGFSDIFLLEISTISKDAVVSRVAGYTVNPLGSTAQTESDNPEKKAWNFNFTGDNGGVNNRETMKIVWDVQNAKCKDAGLYSCRVGYFLNGIKKFANKSVDVRAEYETSEFDLTVEHKSSGHQPPDSHIVIFQCKIRGPDGLKFQWEKWISSSSGAKQLESLPTDAVIADGLAGYLIDNYGCVNSWIQSVLTIRHQATYRQETYACIVSKRGQEVKRENITIDILPQQQLIVDVNDVIDVETFTITCDASRVDLRLQDHPISVSELAIEARLGSSLTFVKIAQYVACGPFGSLEYQNKIPGRDWVFNFTGSNSGIDNTATMRIEIQVRDPTYFDAGVYRCTVRYFSDRGRLVEVMQEHELTALVLPIVKRDRITYKQSLNVTCNSRRVEAFGSKFNPEVVGALVIQAKMGTSQTYTKIAEYLSYGPQENLQFQNPPPDRNWIFTFAGSNNGVNNSKTMSLDIEVKETRCDDAGTYLCQVMFYSAAEGTVWRHQEQNVTVVFDSFLYEIVPAECAHSVEKN